MPHHLMDVARIGAPFQTVGAIAVVQLMEENRNAELAPGVLYGALHNGLG